jgi:hypothetical protein
MDARLKKVDRGHVLSAGSGEKMLFAQRAACGQRDRSAAPASDNNEGEVS